MVGGQQGGSASVRGQSGCEEQAAGVTMTRQTLATATIWLGTTRTIIRCRVPRRPAGFRAAVPMYLSQMRML